MLYPHLSVNRQGGDRSSSFRLRSVSLDSQWLCCFEKPNAYFGMHAGFAPFNKQRRREFANAPMRWLFSRPINIAPPLNDVAGQK
jgi:hypothetical protein